MTVRVFSIVGDALNFGGRRMETIMRVAWLPVALLLLVNMTTLFAYVSLAAGKVVTFGDLVPTFTALQRYGAEASRLGWERAPGAMTAVTATSALLQLILIASFMAPLIRYAGLGEKPARGVLYAPFGGDQLRLLIGAAATFLAVGLILVAPMLLTTAYAANYVSTAFSQTFAQFSDPQSLHTIDLVEGRNLIAAAGREWVYLIGVPAAIAAPLFLGLWALLMAHFHPRNRDDAGGAPNALARGVVTLLLAAALGALAMAGLNAVQGQGERLPIGFAALIAIFLVLIYYAQLRLAPYPAVVVCRRSMAPAGTLAATRGWRLLRVLIAIVLIFAFLGVVQYVVNEFVLQQWLRAVVISTFETTAAYSKLVSAGEQAPWILPTFTWIWNGLRILINVFWTFFSYGVVAGLFGRLYRETVSA